MIDFRYHVVSIIAVFLALTVGLVLGSSFVGQAVLNNLSSQVNNDNSKINNLHDQIQSLQASVGYQESVMSKVVAPLVSGRLTGHDVAVVAVPGASGSAVSTTVSTLKQAGATVVTQLTLTSAYSDLTQRTTLASVATRNNPGGGAVSGGAQAQAAFDIAAALTHRTAHSTTGTTPPTTPATATTTTRPGATGTRTGSATTTNAGTTENGTAVLSPQQSDLLLTAFSDAGFISFSGSPSVAADMVLVIAGTPLTTGADQAASDQVALMHALSGLDAVTVVGGTSYSATAPGLIASVIGDGWADKNVSSVDTVDQGSGQVGVVFALYDQYADGKVGHYGMTGTTDGPLPSPLNVAGTTAP